MWKNCKWQSSYSYPLWEIQYFHICFHGVRKNTAFGTDAYRDRGPHNRSIFTWNTTHTLVVQMFSADRQVHHYLLLACLWCCTAYTCCLLLHKHKDMLMHKCTTAVSVPTLSLLLQKKLKYLYRNAHTQNWLLRRSYRKSWATIFCKVTCFIIDKPNTPP